MKFGMNHIHLKAEDVRATASWYADNFGATIIEEVNNNGVTTIRTEIGGVRINITEPPPEGLPEGTSSTHMGLEHFGLGTDDIDAAMDALKQNGVAVLEPIRTLPSGLRIAFVEAPNNVRLELVESS
ncbi:VOC family protein [SAR202 cluster bacterium AD-804-J14_MRT_500m]|nr:VOC family protein [SAR202 cluster bacterium AD-804-J14_MRT_500m]